MNSTVAASLFRRAEHQLQVAQPAVILQQSYSAPYISAADAHGITVDDDPLSRTGPAEDGVWITPVPADAAGRRQDSCTGYLNPVTAAGGACSHNLFLIQAATAAEIITRGDRATGVKYFRTDAPAGKQARRIHADKEVIVSSGPYGSPKLLQLSGIGPRSLLHDLGIHLVKDLPVGTNTLVRCGRSQRRRKHFHMCTAMCMAYQVLRGESSKRLATPRNTKDKKQLQSTHVTSVAASVPLRLSMLTGRRHPADLSTCITVSNALHFVTLWHARMACPKMAGAAAYISGRCALHACGDTVDVCDAPASLCSYTTMTSNAWAGPVSG